MKNRIYYFSLILLFSILNCNSSKQIDINPVIQKQATIPEAYLGKLSLFILVGQSNMSGRGELPAEAQEINPRVFVFGNDYRWHHAIEPIDLPSEQVDAVSIDHDAGYSIAKSFAKRARAASTVGKIAGLLFCQGPADARDPEKYPEKMGSPFQWKEKFIQFIEDIRADLEWDDLPVVFSQMGSSTHLEKWLYWEEVKKQQGEVSVPNVIMTTEANLPLSEAVHLTKEGYDSLGVRYAEAFIKLTEKGKPQ
jgi:hypothetical protein